MAPDADATAGPPQGWHDLEAVLAEEPVATLLAAYLGCPQVARCRDSRSAPFFRELGVDPRAEPGLLPTPAQTFLEQDLVHPAAPHGNALVLQQIGCEPVKRPRRERQTEAARVGQGCRDHHRDLIRRVGRRAPRAVVILQSCEPFGIE